MAYSINTTRSQLPLGKNDSQFEVGSLDAMDWGETPNFGFPTNIGLPDPSRPLDIEVASLDSKETFFLCTPEEGISGWMG